MTPDHDGLHRDGPADRSRASLRVEDAVNAACPWSGEPVAADALTLYNGAVVGFCNTGCRDKFETAVRAFEAALQARRVERAGLGQ